MVLGVIKMNSAVYSEIYSKALDRKFDVEMINLKNMNIVTTVPTRKGENITFSNEDELSISYFFGHFKYSFDVSLQETIENEKGSFYVFKIKNADIENNYRKERRRNVEYRAIYWTKEGISFATILDMSEKGLKIRTSKPLSGSTIELYYNERESKDTKKIKGTIQWTKQVGDTYEYGMLKIKSTH